MPDEPNEEPTEETVPKWMHDYTTDFARFLGEENERLRNRSAAYLLGDLIARGADAVVEIWKERKKWEGWK